jgi:hypothetical protein
MDVFPENPGRLRRALLIVGVGFVACGGVTSIVVRQKEPSNFAVLPPVTLAGRVFTRLKDVSVRRLDVLARQTGKGPRQSATLSWIAHTNFAGTYFFTAATPGPVDVFVNRPHDARWTVRIVKDVATPRRQPVWIELVRGVTVKGRLVRDGKPLADIALGLKSAERDAGTHPSTDRIEATTDGAGRFSFEHVGVAELCWLYAETGRLPQDGALAPVAVETGEDQTTLDVGDLEVRPGLSLAGRVVLSDGKPVPEGTTLTAWPLHAWGGLSANLDRTGHFVVRGLPPGPVSASVDFPEPPSRIPGWGYRPVSYRLSPRNACFDPECTWQLVGRIDRDIADLTIECDP